MEIRTGARVRIVPFDEPAEVFELRQEGEQMVLGAIFLKSHRADQNLPFPATDIEALKSARRSLRQKPPELLALEPILREKGFIKNEDVRRELNFTRIQALRFLQRLLDQGFLRQEGKGRGARYVQSEKMNPSQDKMKRS